jgi:cell division inhibitor SepF
MKIFKGVKQVFGLEGADEKKEEPVEEDIQVEVEEKEEDLVLPTEKEKNVILEELEDEVYNNSDNISDYQTIFVNPTKFEDCKKIANYINQEKIVTINLEALTTDEAQRMLDFLGGAMEVKKARFITVSKKVFVSVPDGIKSYVQDEE